ncbi:dgat2l1-prov protein, putative, partial [Eimeria acervulina]
NRHPSNYHRCQYAAPLLGAFAAVFGGPGRAVLLVVGGAKEALLGKGGENNLVLKRRKGMFEIALQTGSSLVPVFSLGENDMYDWIEANTFICRFLKFVSRKTMAFFGFSLPLIYGRGLLQLTMPKRVKIIEVVGDPIPAPLIPNPSQKDIEELRQRYCEALHRVYEKARAIYGPEGRFADLRIVE